MAEGSPSERDADRDATETVTQQTRPLPERFPTRIGHYHVKRVLASGGMGVVYEATQENPRRVVAVKLMKHGITSRSALRRFEYEAQILARLRHPGIAQIYEAGTHDDGSGPLPYFAMEYIANALPITDYTRSKKLTVPQRLELFARACDAVHCGHQKGVIHRDLKPGNILVDAHGDVKIIDFGVARGTDSDLAVTTLQTDVGQLIGTLQYMSPEQCDGDPQGLDIRSDVYSLGVVLYEVLCGALPYDVSRQTLANGTRVIREQAPTRLSVADPSLRGDVETIVLKALEKDRDRRYPSASELAQDIRRYLAGEPILARRPSLAYQLRLLVRRNKALVASAAGIFLALVAGLAASTTLYLRAQRERDRARAAEAETTAINDFLLEDMLTLPDPELGRGQTLTVREALDAAAARIPLAFADQPVLGARIRATIGGTYLNLGLYDEAEAHLTATNATLHALLGPEHPYTLSARRWNASLLMRQGRYAEAETEARSALAAARRLLGETHPETLELTNQLCGAIYYQGRYDEATGVARAGYELSRKALGDENRITLGLMNNLAISLGARGKWAENEVLARRALVASRRALGDEHPRTIALMRNLAVSLGVLGKSAEEEALTRQALEISRRVLGEEHATTLVLMRGLGKLLAGQGKWAESDSLTKRSLEVAERVLGAAHPDTLSLMVDTAGTFEQRGDHAEQVRLLRRALEISRTALGEEHYLTLRATNDLADALCKSGHPEEGEQLAREALALAVRTQGTDKYVTLAAKATLGLALYEQGEFLEAKRLYEESLEALRKNFPEVGDALGELRLELGRCQTALGEFDAAETNLLAAYEQFHPTRSLEPRNTLTTLTALIDLYVRRGRPDRADDLRNQLEEWTRQVDHAAEGTPSGNQPTP